MATTDKLVKLEQLTRYDENIKKFIDEKVAQDIKAIGFSDDGLKLLCYKTVDKSDTPDEIDIPEELLKDWFFDVTKSGVVENFEWSETTYPDTTDPDLDGKPVVVFALSKGEDIHYSFASLEGLVATYEGEDSTSATTTITDGKIKSEVKISTKEGNGLSVDEENGGLYVNAADELDYATDEDIDALFETKTTFPDESGDENTEETENENTNNEPTD